MSNITVFEIDDDFDPLEDLRLDEEDEKPATDYLPPIPDAELSRVPEEVPLTAEERIEKLLAGIPGQTLRLLRAVQTCAEPKTFSEIDADLQEAFPVEVSVYGSAQIVELLERAGALEEQVTEEDSAPESFEPAGDYLVVTPAKPRTYLATAAGLAAVEARSGEHVVREALLKEPQYVPLYRTILEMTSEEGGCATKELDVVIDNDPLCEEPRRFCGYFLDRLEEAGAVQWNNAWVATKLGREVLASDIFNA